MEKIITIEKASKPGVVDLNNRVYTLENFNELLEKENERLKNGNIVLCLDSITNVPYSIDPDKVIGIVKDIQQDHISVLINDQNIYYNDIINGLYMAGLCSLAIISSSMIEYNNKNITMVNHHHIICFHLIPKTINNTPTILIKYHREICPKLKQLEIIPNGDFVDLRSAENISLKAGERAFINLGVSIKLPEGYWAQIVPRSSTCKKFKIVQTNSFGVVDESYCGNDDIWKMPVIALEDTEININDRICQFRIVKKQPFTIKEVDELYEENRGGFGSTGTN